MSHFFTVYRMSSAVFVGNILPIGEYSGTVKNSPKMSDCLSLHRRSWDMSINISFSIHKK
jgi:hypothetical protein